MATASERVTAIANALVNGTATADQKARLGEALAIHGAAHAEYVAATNAGKAEIGIRELRRLMLSVIKSAEAAEAIQQARADATGAVDADFSEP